MWRQKVQNLPTWYLFESHQGHTNTKYLPNQTTHELQVIQRHLLLDVQEVFGPVYRGDGAGDPRTAEGAFVRYKL